MKAAKLLVIRWFFINQLICYYSIAIHNILHLQYNRSFADRSVNYSEKERAEWEESTVICGGGEGGTAEMSSGLSGFSCDSGWCSGGGGIAGDVALSLVIYFTRVFENFENSIYWLWLYYLWFFQLFIVLESIYED